MMAGFVGVDYRHFSPRTLMMMYLGRIEDQWNQTSCLLASQHNQADLISKTVQSIFCSVKPSIMTADEFHPLRGFSSKKPDANRLVLTPENLHHLKILATG